MPRNSLISFESGSAMRSRVGKAGSTPVELSAIRPRLAEIRKELKSARSDGRVGFLSIPERRGDLKAVREAVGALGKRFRTLVVIGIGGSDLGARTFLRALDGRSGMEVRFIGANTDPEEIAQLLSEIDLKSTVLNVVSKSGGTIEPMSTFLLLRDRLVRKVGRKAHARQVVATTDRKSGTLRAIADREGYMTLPVPDDIGGRFSALTPVGLFPAACAGIDTAALVRGARAVRDDFFDSSPASNDVLKWTALNYLGYAKRDQRITVLMPYAARLDTFGDWFRQLWAESLGKLESRAGRKVRHGFTPVSALGATDQHSQLQLYSDGPLDKTVTFIGVDRFRQDFTVPGAYSDLEGLAYTKGHAFSDIINAERRATAHALAESGVPNVTLRVPEISEESVGGLMMFFMLATAAMGELLDVNAYDQPGVEASKRAMYGLLGRPGFTVPKGLE